MKKIFGQGTFPIITGLLFIAIGIICSERMFAELFSPDHSIGSGKKRLLIWIFDIIFLSIGFLLILLNRKDVIIKLSNKLLLFLSTLLIMLIVFELIFPSVLPMLPLNLQGYVDPAFRILCQSSKNGKLPQDYIAITGDSYAHGYGDWLLETNPWTNSKFHSAHVLHDTLNRDVISFGSSGSSLIGSLIRKPAHDLRILRYRFSVDDPRIILAYFYEGNDLRDNLVELSVLHFPGLVPSTQSIDKNVLRNFLSNKVLRKNQDNVLHGYTVSLKFIMGLVDNAINRLLGNSKYQDMPEETIWESSVYNKALINGTYQYLPDGLQGPVLDMSKDEIYRASSIVEVSLHLLKKEFPNSYIALVYIPSVLSCYTLQDTVSVQAPEGYPVNYSAQSVYSQSDTIARNIEKVCRDNGLTFIDTRGTLRAAASKQVIHGPKDWKHFNKTGYEVFADSIISSFGNIH
jgi:hypothetical protein